MLEYRHVLVCIWGKILAFDISCQADLVKDQACPNFISHLSWGLKNDMGEEKLLTEEKYSSYENSEEDALEQRMMAAFILSTICMNFCPGQNECLRLNLHVKCGELLDYMKEKSNSSLSRQPVFVRFTMWLCLCLARLTENNIVAQKEVFTKGIHERLFFCLHDQNPSVRAAAAYSLGCLIRSPRKRMSQEQLFKRNYGGRESAMNTSYQDSQRVNLDLIVAQQ